MHPLRRTRGVWYNTKAMTEEEIVNSKELKSVVEDYRSMCFWNFAEDFMPKDRRQVFLALDTLERYGNMDAYRRAGEIRQWL